MPDNKPKKKAAATPKPSVLRIADYNEYVSRKRAYDDSSTTYQNSIDNHNKLLAIGMKKTGSSKPTKDEADEMLVTGGTMNNFKHSYTDESGNTVNKKAKLFQTTSSKIAPVKTNTYTGKALTDADGVSYQQETTIPIYKAPSQRVAYDDSIDRKAAEIVKQQAPAEKARDLHAKRSVGGYKKVASSDPKYKNLREYSTYKQNSDSLVEDPFKKKMIENRNKTLSKPTTKALPKRNSGT